MKIVSVLKQVVEKCNWHATYISVCMKDHSLRLYTPSIYYVLLIANIHWWVCKLYLCQLELQVYNKLACRLYIESSTGAS